LRIGVLGTRAVGTCFRAVAFFDAFRTGALDTVLRVGFLTLGFGAEARFEPDFLAEDLGAFWAAVFFAWALRAAAFLAVFLLVLRAAGLRADVLFKLVFLVVVFFLAGLMGAGR
jgi:hypothetical protein